MTELCWGAVSIGCAELLLVDCESAATAASAAVVVDTECRCENDELASAHESELPASVRDAARAAEWLLLLSAAVLAGDVLAAELEVAVPELTV